MRFGSCTHVSILIYLCILHPFHSSGHLGHYFSALSLWYVHSLYAFMKADTFLVTSQSQQKCIWGEDTIHKIKEEDSGSFQCNIMHIRKNTWGVSLHDDEKDMEICQGGPAKLSRKEQNRTLVHRIFLIFSWYSSLQYLFY